MSGGPALFQTQMGRRYYESTLPRLVDALERIAKAMEVANEKKDVPLVNLDGSPEKERG